MLPKNKAGGFLLCADRGWRYTSSVRYQRARNIVKEDFERLRLRAASTFLKMLETITPEDVLRRMDAGRAQYKTEFRLTAKQIHDEFRDEVLDALAYQSMADERA